MIGNPYTCCFQWSVMSIIELANNHGKGERIKFIHEVNTYKGTGSFVAKMESGKECKFETEWHFVVVSPERIIGASTNITADKNTCEIRRKDQAQLELKKTKR